MDNFKILAILVAIFGVMFLFWMIDKRVNTWADLWKAIKARGEEYNLIPYTRWYVRIKFNQPKNGDIKKNLLSMLNLKGFIFILAKST